MKVILIISYHKFVIPSWAGLDQILGLTINRSLSILVSEGSYYFIKVDCNIGCTCSLRLTGIALNCKL